jgi:hypothetical protein
MKKLSFIFKLLPSFVRFDIINKERRYCYGICSCIFSVLWLGGLINKLNSIVVFSVRLECASDICSLKQIVDTPLDCKTWKECSFTLCN